MSYQSNRIKELTSLLFLVLLSCACNPQEEILPIDPENELETGVGLPADELDVYQGDIGLFISARDLARKGYQPTRLEVAITAESGDFSQDLELDPLTLIGQLKWSLEELGETAVDELQRGVDLTIRTLDANGELIKERVYASRSFKSDPPVLVLDASDLKDLNTDIELNPEASYYLQIVDEAGNPTGQALTLKDLPIPHDRLKNALVVGGKHQFSGSEGKSLFRFRPLKGVQNGFVIYNPTTKRTLEHLSTYLGTHAIRGHFGGDRFFEWSESRILQHPTLYFILKKEGNGIYTLQCGDKTGTMINAPTIGLSGSKQWTSYQESTIVRFRLINMDVQWDFEPVATRYFDPVLPKASTSFGFNNTLINCGLGPLVQDVGSAVSETISRTTGWEESISLSTTHHQELSVSMGIEVEGKFFGNGATYSANVSGTVSVTNNATSTDTKWGTIEEVTEESFFLNRTVTIPPKSASLVVDALQTYNDVRIHLVQQLRVRGKDLGANYDLSGEEITSLLGFSGFDGVVTKVGSDFVEVTVKGTTTIGKWIESKSEVREADPKCDE